MVMIVGPSGVEMDIEVSVAEGLVDGGHARYVTGVIDEHVVPADTKSGPIEPVIPDSDERPKGNAGLDVWAAYAAARGQNVDGLSRDDIRALFKA